MNEAVIVRQDRRGVVGVDRAVLWLARHWLAVFNMVWGVFVILPWLAPVMMRAGLTGPAKGVYLAYSFVCHQLPERSYFLFGSQPTYSLTQINRVWPGNNPVTLRQFIGNAQFGYKVAWSDRMISMYGGIWLGALAFALVRRRFKPISMWAYAVCAAPMALDGTTHLISDLWGIGQGFRDSNEWLAVLTNHALPAWFYAGDALGSFNSWMRLLTGLLFGLGSVALMMPYLEQSFAQIREELERRVSNDEG
jgi:uncharacterized membrane protein